MSNITEFPQPKKGLEQKYQEVLEENRSLYKRLDNLEKKLEEQSTNATIFDKIKKRLNQKKRSMKRRSETMADVNTIAAYRSLRDIDKHPELFAIIKNARWALHAVNTEFNLSVRKRRLVKGVSQSFTAYANARPKYLTLMRICMNKYSTNKIITSASLIEAAENQKLAAPTVYRFLADSVVAGTLIKNTDNTYILSDELKEDYFFNLLQMIFSWETINFVSLLGRVYSMVDLKLLSSNQGADRLGINDEYRREEDTSYETILKLLSNESLKEDS